MELPQDFKKRMKDQLKDGDAYEAFLISYEKERAYGLRYNPLKIGKEKLQTALLKELIALEKVPWAEEGFYYPADAHPGKLPLHEAGAYYIQEPSAMIGAELLDPKPGEKILDLCAAPGGKSTQIAGRMQGRGLLVSNEVIPQRAKTLSRNIERMGVRNAVVLNETPQRLADRFPLFFDRIVVDAPCSGEGMFRKDIGARGEWSLEQVEICAERQRDILAQAAMMLKPGGVLVYSTCTFAPQENEQNAEWFVQEYPQFIVEKQEQIWPHLQRGEGHFAVKLYKQELQKISEEIFEKRMPKQEFLEHRAFKTGAVSALRKADSPEKTDDSKNKRIRKAAGVHEIQKEAKTPYQELSDFCKETLTENMQKYIFERIADGQLAVFGEQLYLVPPEIGRLDGLKTERAGLQLGCCKKKRFEPSHALAMALHPEDVKQTLVLEEPERYLRGETIRCGIQKGWTLVTIDGCSIGWGKASQGVLKNHYPKGLRRH